MNKTQRALMIAFDKGYRVVEGELYYKGKKRKSTVSNKGYLFFTVRNDESEKYPVFIHRLVAFQKYKDLIFETGAQVRHFDGNKLNNLDINILIGTAYDNSMDRKPEDRMRCALMGTDCIKKHNHDEVLNLYSQGLSYGKIMKLTGIKSKGSIGYIVKESIKSKML
jgi:hypothetical protein